MFGVTHNVSIMQADGSWAHDTKYGFVAGTRITAGGATSPLVTIIPAALTGRVHQVWVTRQLNSYQSTGATATTTNKGITPFALRANGTPGAFYLRVNRITTGNAATVGMAAGATFNFLALVSGTM